MLPLSTLDLTAIAVFVGAIAAFESTIRLRALAQRSLTVCMQRQRVRWIENMAEREQRHIDAILLSSLSQSNAFFASTCVIAIGGLAALMGAAQSAQPMLERLPFVVQAPAALWEIKILSIISILVYAFFKYAWAFRLSHYTAIMFGAMPPLDGPPEKRGTHAAHTARLLGLVGDHANSGLRSFYYALAATAWVFHPVMLMLAITAVVIILARREFVSRAAAIVAAA